MIHNAFTSACAAEHGDTPHHSLTSETIRRGVDLTWSITIGILAAPIWLLVLVSYLLGRQPIRSTNCLGKGGVRFRRLQLDASQIVGGWVLARTQLDEFLGFVLNVVRGEMTLVGPRPLAIGESQPNAAILRHRCSVTPGLICLWWLRRRANMAYETEWSTDHEYVQQRGLTHDLGVVVRSLVALLHGQAKASGAEASIVGIGFDNVSMNDAIDRIQAGVRQPGLTRVAFINADCVNLASRNVDYLSALKSADHVFADGIGIKIAGQLSGFSVKENVNGTDLFPRLCHAIADTKARLFLLGGRPGVAERVSDWISEHEAGVDVCGLHHGYFQPSEQDDVIQQINQSGAEIVLVAFGAPKQDVWIRDVLSRSNARVGIGVGGLFDFYSGRIPRAPLWMREMGLEWTFRLYQEPRRLWRRYVIGNLTFLARVIAYRIRNRRERTTSTNVPRLETL